MSHSGSAHRGSPYQPARRRASGALGFSQVDADLDQLAAAPSRYRAVRQWVALEVLVIQWDSPPEFGWQTGIVPDTVRSRLPSPAIYASAPAWRRHGSMPP